MIKNLGNLSGRLLVFGGPYSNLQATQALFDIARDLDIPKGNIICTGDITAYCANPEETSRLIYESGVHCIQGNCDEALAQDIDDCACGFDEDSLCNMLAKTWYDFSVRKTSQEMKNWMGSLPKRLEFIFGNKKFHVLHGSHNSMNEFIFKSANPEYVQAQIGLTKSDIIIGGHNGMHFTSVLENTVWHNAGVIGMPANDGTPRTWYSIIEETDEGIVFQHKALTYDHCTASQIMMKNGLQEYGKAVETGLWPSLDVLPDIEKTLTGKAREEESFTLYF